MNSSFSDFITTFFEKTASLMANFFLLLILYNYFFVRNDSIINITYKELYIIGFVSSLSGIVLALPKKKSVTK